MPEKQKPSRKTSKSLRGNILLAVGSVAIMALLLEVGTRVALTFVFHREVPEIWKLEYEPYVLHYSRGGLRQREIYAEQPAKGDRYRILVLGGSTAAQFPVDMLETHFQKATDREVEVINLSDGGYIANQDLVMLAVHGARLEPDLVVSFDGFNDIVNMTKGMPPGMNYHGQTIKFAVEHPFLNGMRSIVNKSQFVLTMVKLRERRGETASQQDPARLDAMVERYIHTLQTTGLLATAIGADYVPVLQPYLHLRETITEREQELERLWAFRTEFMRSAFRKLESELAAHQFPGDVYYVSGITAFNNTNEEVFTDQCHLTDPGKELCLEFVIDQIRQKGLVMGQNMQDG